MNIIFAQKIDILSCTVISYKDLYVVFLNSSRLFFDPLILIRDLTRKKPFPFVIGKGIVINLLQLPAQVLYQIGFRGDRQVLVRLCGELVDKRPFELCLALIRTVANTVGKRAVFCDNRAFRVT